MRQIQVFSISTPGTATSKHSFDCASARECGCCCDRAHISAANGIWAAVVVTAIFTFINAWNEFAVVYTLIRSPENKTLTVQMTDMVAGKYVVDWHLVMAATLCATLPLSVVFAWLQRYLVKGLALRTVK